MTTIFLYIIINVSSFKSWLSLISISSSSPSSIAYPTIILLVKPDYPSLVLKYVPYIQEVRDLLSANSMQETK